MFTGLIEGTGNVVSFRREGAEAELAVDLGDLSAGVGIGDSIALSGCCCTVTRWSGAPRADTPLSAAPASGAPAGGPPPGRVASFHLSAETLSRTWFGRLRPGDPLNLERSLRIGDRMGGHLVQGHVDGLGVVERPCAGGTAGGTLVVRLDPAHLRYCVEKGSIALDGVSLTIADVRDGAIALAIIPHTAAVTTLGSRQPGDALHVEVDVIAKYVERLVAPHLPPPASGRS